MTLNELIKEFSRKGYSVIQLCFSEFTIKDKYSREFIETVSGIYQLEALWNIRYKRLRYKHYQPDWIGGRELLFE